MTTYLLSRGRHQPAAGRYCAMELLALATGQPADDHPRGVDNVLRNVVMCMNDAADSDAARSRLLLPYVLADPEDIGRGPGRLYGTDDGRTKARMRIVFGLCPFDQLRDHLARLARESDADPRARQSAWALLDRLIDPTPAIRVPRQERSTTRERELVPL